MPILIMSEEKKQTSKTLFVGNLPFTTTTEDLTSAYEEFGPIKSCFVVKDNKGEENRCKGFGYVVFSVREDSEKAQKTVIKIGGRRVNAVFAKPKDRQKRGKRKPTEGEEETTNEPENVTQDADLPKDRTEEIPASPQKISSPNAKKKRRKKWDEDSDKTLVVTGLPADYKIDQLTSGCKQVAKVTFPAPDRQQLTALVKFETKDAANKALGKINKKGKKGIPIKAIFLYKESWNQPSNNTTKDASSKELNTTTEKRAPKWCKLIIRNLSFKCEDEDLKKVFNKFGDVTEVKIPVRLDGKKFGYGFVQFTNMTDAQKAITSMNAKPILGRPVAVDWALSRDKYQKVVGVKSDQGDGSTSKNQTEQPQKENQKKAPQKRKEDSDSEEEEEDEDGSQESEAEEESEESETDVKSKNVKGKLKNVNEESGSEDDKEDDESDDGEDESEDDDDESDDSDEDDSDEEDSDDEGFSEGSSDDQAPKKKPLKKKGPRSDDVGEGKTLFIRNVSFDTMEEDLEESLEEFGEIKYCRIVMDPATEHSKGVAFVQFVDKEDAEKCLQQSEDEQTRPGGIVVDGRRLKLTPAVSREEAGKLKIQTDKDKEKKDKRNLWLLREGLIRPGTQAAQGLSKADLLKREQVEKLKRQKLKNPDVFVSPTRLCIRNIPTSVTDKQLKKLYLKAAQDKAANIKECRIMRDLNRMNASGLGKSRGYAFIEFTDHKHALAALRQSNNNPELFGDKKRLIVEFSLESRSALRTKQERLERAKSKQEMMQRNARGGKGDRASRGKKKITVGAVQAPPEGVDAKKIPRGMPSHMGPKIRHKPRAPAQTGKKPKDKVSRKVAQDRKEKRKAENTIQEPSKKKRRAAPYKTDDIDKLVAKYRTTFNQAAMKKKSQKWFET